MLKVIFSCAVAAMLFACGQGNTKDTAEKTNTENAQSQDDDQEQKNKQTVQRIYEDVINKKQVNLVNEFYVENVVDHSAWPNQAPGRQGLIESINDFHKSFTNLHVTVDEIITKGDKVITRESWSGVNNATNENKSGTVMHIFKFKDGKITDEWSEGWEWLQ